MYTKETQPRKIRARARTHARYSNLHSINKTNRRRRSGHGAIVGGPAFYLMPEQGRRSVCHGQDR